VAVVDFEAGCPALIAVWTEVLVEVLELVQGRSHLTRSALA
jgi:hypothetical protein